MPEKLFTLGDVNLFPPEQEEVESGWPDDFVPDEDACRRAVEDAGLQLVALEPSYQGTYDHTVRGTVQALGDWLQSLGFYFTLTCDGSDRLTLELL